MRISDWSSDVCSSDLAGPFEGRGVTTVVGIEARGFLVGAPVALHLGAGFVPVRKPGKLPRPTECEEYALEYGVDRLEIHADAIAAGERVLVSDDVNAPGGTAAATVALVERLGELGSAAYRERVIRFVKMSV